MSVQVHLLFCESPFELNNIDPDFEEEYLIAKKNDFKTLIFNFEDFTTHLPDKVDKHEFYEKLKKLIA